MNGIRLLLLLVASAQVEAGTERDYGWAVNKEDGVLEYIVQINEDKLRAMGQKSVQFPNGRENVSNMPRELVGRAHRVVIRIGTEILPREPSLQELERAPRLYEQPNVSAAAMLGEGQLKDLESPVRNIQGQGAAPVFPALPSGLAGAQGQAGSLIDSVGQAANSLRNESENLSGAMPDPSLLAQSNLQGGGLLGGASDFPNETRGPAAGAGSKFNSTAPPAGSAANPAANSALNSAINSQPTAPPRLPDSPPFAGSANPAATNSAGANNRTGLSNGLGSALSSGQGTGFGTNNPASSVYPTDRLNPPSLTAQSTLPRQQTPSSTFGTSPGLAGHTANDWNTTNPNVPNYPPSMSQPQDNYNYGGSTNYPQSYTSLGGNQNSTRIAANTPPYGQQNSPQNSPQGNGNLTGRPTTPAGGVLTQETEAALLALDKNKDGRLTAEEYTPASVDGILLTLFVVSLLVNLYLGHLIRKLLMRYRVVLTNVRSQAAYT